MPTLEERIYALEQIHNNSSTGEDLPEALNFDVENYHIIYNIYTSKLERIKANLFPLGTYTPHATVESIPYNFDYIAFVHSDPAPITETTGNGLYVWENGAKVKKGSEFEEAGIVEGSIKGVRSGDAFIALSDKLDKKDAFKSIQLLISNINVAYDFQTGWIDVLDGHLVTEDENVNALNWRTTKPISVLPNIKIKRISQLLNNYNDNIAVISFWKGNEEYLGYYSPDPFPNENEVLISDFYNDCEYIKVCYVASSTKELYLDFFIDNSKVEGVTENINKVNNVININKINTVLLSGYINTSLNFVANSNYITTPKTPVNGLSIVKYTGSSGNLVTPIIGYDSEDNKTALLPYGDYINEKIIISKEIVAIEICANSTKDYSFEILDFEEPKLDFFYPKQMYAVEGRMFRVYSKGIFKNNIDDVRWSVDNGSKDFFDLRALNQTGNDVELSCLITNKNYKDKLIGTANIKITHTTQSPLNPINIIGLGDSTMQGVNSIDGAVMNELSRLLTGTGTGIGDYQPTSLALNNIHFRGTRGDQPIKHEGRGGWSAFNYLNNNSFSGITNAFWDGSKFSLDYYLTQNNFKAADVTGGVNATGSNLIVYIQLGWNDIRVYGIEQAKTYLQSLITAIHTEYPDTTIKLMGLPTPPEVIIRSDKENWSREKVMQKFVIPQAKEWQDIADNTNNVDFIPIAPFFDPTDAYLTTTVKKNNRTLETIDICRDNVHSGPNGYAQIADILFDEFVFNNCRLN